MDAAHEAGINFFDTANVYGGASTRAHRGDHRALVRQRRRPAGADRPGHQGLRRHGRAGRTTTSSQRSTSAEPWTRASSGCRPTTSTSTSSTTSTGTLRGRRSGRRSRSRSSRARSSTRAAATSPVGTSPRHRPPPAERNLIGLVSEQSLYNLLGRDIEMEVIPAAEDYGLGVIPWSPLQGGLLGGVIKKENDRRAAARGPRGAEPRRTSRPDPGVRGPARRSTASSPATSAWPGCSPGPAVTGPIIGPRTAEQLDSALAPSSWSWATRSCADWTRSSPVRDRSGGLRLVAG